ncbi:BEL1-like homeodomain protein 1 [Salvia hispanica]|uniref:BEL1-like homeodomain protein 1 n=1 Tax=Salvia hispanica TaxID=49212 RepID=UPI0020096D34|nr:BEL1-like homeodomain protein 1 [Salvia hispanica]
MATYFLGNTEMQGNGDALQTLILMNPANQHHHLPPPSFGFLNSTNASHEIHGIPLHYNGGVGAPDQVKRGLSLSLSGEEEVRVFEKAALSCKYLKAAQQLLDEVVNIRKEAKKGREPAKEDNGKDPEPSTGKRGAELTTVEKQEIQMKKAKLVDMLHEVEKEYKQYNEQMKMVIRWLEEAAGVGSAKSYTALALQTISKQFRCLKDAIMGQIRGASRNLGEDSGLKLMEVSRFHDHINNAWRPQRGLPERSVSVLRAWLFHHFLHPYPKDSDKIMLAKQAGLTRSQVSNWFINARVRLWKPMVEEMYAEEMKAQQRNESEEEHTIKIEHKNKDFVNQNTSSTSPTANDNEGFGPIGSSEMDSIMDGIRSHKKPRKSDVSLLSPSMSMSEVENQHIIPMKVDYESERQSRRGFTITGAPANFFGSYDPTVGIEQFQQPYSINGVSLTLGLQHCENLSNQTFMHNRSVEGDAQGNDFVDY